MDRIDDRFSPNPRLTDILTRILLTLAALFLIPALRNSGMALCNRLFAASEQLNAYQYERFPVTGEPSVIPAAVLLSLIGLTLFALVLTTRNPLLIGALALILAGGQAYFGLSLSAPLNIALFSLLGLLLIRDRLRPGTILCFLICLALITAAVTAWRPGVDPWTETQSESARDRLSHSFIGLSGVDPDGDGEIPETRHVNSRDLLTGEEASEPGREFRLITEEEEQVSLPEWLQSLSRALPWIVLTIMAAALIFFIIRVIRARKKAAAFRAQFTSEDRAGAVCAMFRHISDWLASFGMDGGNHPFCDWTPGLSQSLSPEYAEDFAACVPVFEEAAYSGHDIPAEERDRVRALVDATEKLLYARADLAKKFRLKYTECLYQ